jgi:hypothetical protein
MYVNLQKNRIDVFDDIFEKLSGLISCHFYKKSSAEWLKQHLNYQRLMTSRDPFADLRDFYGDSALFQSVPGRPCPISDMRAL